VLQTLLDGYDLHFTSCSDDALNAVAGAEPNPFRGVIADLILPEKKEEPATAEVGLQLLERLRSTFPDPASIVVASANASGYLEKLEQLKVRVLLKPFGRAELQEALRR